MAAPLLNRNDIKAEFHTTNASQQEALFNYEKAVLNGYVEVHNQMAQINALKNRLTLKSDEVNTLSLSVETSNELFKTGRANYLEVLSAHKSALESKLDLIDVRQQQFNATINIYKALGGGWR